MGIIDHTTPDASGTEQAGQLGTVQDISGTGTQKETLGSSVPANAAEPAAAKEKLLVMDGPLSQIYTKALDMVYAKPTASAISQETQQMDTVMVADAHNFHQQQTEDTLEKQKNGAYIYVTDDAHLQGSGLTRTFNDLRIALGMSSFGKRAVCIEHNGNVSKKMELLANYVQESNVPIFFTRHAMLNYLKAL